MRRTETGHALLASLAAVTSAGPYLADWNRTHLFNPDWPPHAKFHDAQSILLGTLLGAAGLLFLRRSRRSGRAEHLRLAAALPGLYWLAQGGSFLFPGAAGLGSEFPDLVPRIGRFRLDERITSTTALAGLALAYRWAKEANGRA